MPAPKTIVSTFIRIEPQLDRPPAEMLRAEGGLSVELEEGRRVRLDPDDPRSVGFAQILDGLSKQRLPVYLEVDPETSAITRLLIPHVTRVVGIRPIDVGVLGVELERSHARHVLRGGARARRRVTLPRLSSGPPATSTGTATAAGRTSRAARPSPTWTTRAR